jgi:hypothetical protein
MLIGIEHAHAALCFDKEIRGDTTNQNQSTKLIASFPFEPAIESPLPMINNRAYG